MATYKASKIQYNMDCIIASKQRVEIPNKFGEKLVGVLHLTGSKNLVIICHGFRSTKDETTIVNLIGTLTREGVGVFHFDFAGNGESEGVFQYGNYRREVDDLHAVVLYLSKKGFRTGAIIGHSKGGNVVVLYASTYDVPVVINLSGRFALERGIEGRLGKDFLQRIKNDGFINVKDKKGNVEYRVTEESLMDRLSTDMRVACHAIGNECRVLTIHGSEDEIVPSEDAHEFDKNIANHKLLIIEGANHCYTAHQTLLASSVLDFLKAAQVVDATATKAV
ncbi:hypothetical protein AXF42_Ash006050 [Apostasia shenzhenica]|uniref:Serine aminopeptidase S33 domain-containing protein n=1 Tax=Apostasia shenzhenica TaxID=1088818 RepID=A0A2I0B040_9ASPA|nr:hypothetical protein AXF42_Ash006050 [Apostasia shenzhenica]